MSWLRHFHSWLIGEHSLTLAGVWWIWVCWLAFVGAVHVVTLWVGWLV